MNFDTHHHIEREIERDDASSQRYRSVMAPRRCEGISNALRAAFDPPDHGVPSEFDRLLQQLN